jgi:2-methylisocitrate lyase-like PEP mutase family enzyme
MSETHPSRALRAALNSRSTSLLIPGAYDALSAKFVEEAGCEAIYVGSYATAAAGYGMPDVGALTLDQLVEHARKVVDATTLPVIADAEGGFFEAPNIWRTVRAFEAAGVAAIHIEDHAGGKHTNLPQRLIPLDLMLDRLKAALDARRSSEFIVMARTDAIWATHDEEEAVRRIEAFSKIGIEYFFANGASPAVLRRIRQHVSGKFVVINLPEVRDRAEWNGAADLVLDYGFCLQAVAKALKAALEQYRSGTRADDTDAFLEDAVQFEARLGYDEFTRRALQYSASTSDNSRKP